MFGIAAAAACTSETAREGAGATASTQTSGATAAVAQQMPAEQEFGSVDTAQRAAVVRYARAIAFVTDPLLVDEQTLIQPRGRGPRARVEPVRHSHLLTRDRMARGALVARFVSDGEYAPLGLYRGVQYFFVDSTRGQWRAIIVPDDAARPVRVMRVVLNERPHEFDAASARWIESAGYSFPNSDCGKLCCVPCTPDRYPCPSVRWPPQLDIDSLMLGGSAGGIPPRE
jgi:hypothetical protein